MEARINHHIRGIFLLYEKTVPPLLEKHLTNNIFKKPNKEAMEQVVYYLLLLISPKCLKTIPWPVTTFKEAAEFRNAITLIINGLDGFVYKKSSSVGKVNSSLLANPGGPIFINFMYQFCLYMKCCGLKVKGIDVLNAPLYIKDEYIDKKIAMFDRISKSNFNEVNEIISRVDYALKNIVELAVKGNEIIQDSKQRINDVKSVLLSIEHCEATENEVAELKHKYMQLYNNFEQNKLIAVKCGRLANIILKTPETWDADTISLNFNINKEELVVYGKVDLVKLLTIIKNTLNSYINWCAQLNDDEEINEKIQETQQSVIHMTKQMQCYEKLMKIQNNTIVSLKTENKKLEKEVFTGESLKNIDPRLQSVYKPIPQIILKADFTSTPKLTTSEESKKSRRSILSHCSSKSYNYQTLSFDEIKEVYRATLPNQNKDIYENINEHSSILNYETNLNSQVSLLQGIDSENSQDKAEIIKEEEVNNISISRRSIENIKQKFMRIKNQGQAMSTIPHSPQ